MIALLAVLGWFSAVQYTPRPVSLRGCSECRGEPDDVCEVRAGAQLLPLEEYARPVAGRIKLLRPSAETACAVPAQKIVGPRAPVELAAVRMAVAQPSPALMETLHLRPGVRGWPRAPQRRNTETIAASPDRAALRLSLLCWPSDRGWPNRALGAANACEWWLLAVNAGGEPDLSGASFALAEPSFPAGSKWTAAFDRNAPLAESIFVSAPPAPAPMAVSAPSAPARCGDGARERTATLDRFDQWDEQIRGDKQPSLERASLTLRTPLWSGHCQEMDVLRAALERQLECVLAVEGRCE